MLVNEVCKACKLTKKAIEYYESQGLVQPHMLENGYRDFTEADMERLKKIVVLRKLGVSVPDIRTILNGTNQRALFEVSAQKGLETEMLETKRKLLQKLAETHDWEYVQEELETLEQKQTILRRLLDAFPGSYGNCLSLHFSLYLKEPMVSDEQQQAFETIISFLDGVELEMPEDLRKYLDETFRYVDADFVMALSDGMNQAVQDPQRYIADNQETFEQYMALKQSDAYRESPAYRLNRLFAEFNQDSGYHDIFIPAMNKLSTSYRRYQEARERANEFFVEKHPEIKEADYDKT